MHVFQVHKPMKYLVTHYALLGWWEETRPTNIETGEAFRLGPGHDSRLHDLASFYSVGWWYRGVECTGLESGGGFVES